MKCQSSTRSENMAFTTLMGKGQGFLPSILRPITFLVGDLNLGDSTGTHQVAVHPLTLNGTLEAYVLYPGKRGHCFLNFFTELHDQNDFYI